MHERRLYVVVGRTAHDAPPRGTRKLLSVQLLYYAFYPAAPAAIDLSPLLVAMNATS